MEPRYNTFVYIYITQRLFVKMLYILIKMYFGTGTASVTMVLDSFPVHRINCLHFLF